MIEFQGFPKLSRLRRDCIVTEKIDGTNACVVIGEDGSIGAQSRTRIITPGDDNFGFAYWVEKNAAALAELLGPGRHFGEWWGVGIQRGYGLSERRFSLFNSYRWRDIAEQSGGLVHCVPILAQHTFSDAAVELSLAQLRMNGSVAAPGFMQPEGVVVFHTAANTMFKVTLEKDGSPKGQVR